MIVFECHCNGHRLVIDEERGSGYGYLLDDGGIRSHVWLYNLVAVPAVENWRPTEPGPLTNPLNYVDVTRMAILSGKRATLSAAWILDEKGQLLRVQILLNEIPYAELKLDDEDCGRTVAACRDNVLARKWS